MADYNGVEGNARGMRTGDSALGRRNRDAQQVGRNDHSVSGGKTSFQPRMATPEQISALKNKDGKVELPNTYRRGQFIDLLA